MSPVIKPPASTLNLIDQGSLKVKELVTHEFNFSQAPEAYKKLLEQSTDSLGIVLSWKNRTQKSET